MEFDTTTVQPGVARTEVWFLLRDTTYGQEVKVDGNR